MRIPQQASGKQEFATNLYMFIHLYLNLEWTHIWLFVCACCINDYIHLCICMNSIYVFVHTCVILCLHSHVFVHVYAGASSRSRSYLRRNHIFRSVFTFRFYLCVFKGHIFMHLHVYVDTDRIWKICTYTYTLYHLYIYIYILYIIIYIYMYNIYIYTFVRIYKGEWWKTHDFLIDGGELAEWSKTASFQVGGLWVQFGKIGNHQPSVRQAQHTTIRNTHSSGTSNILAFHFWTQGSLVEQSNPNEGLGNCDKLDLECPTQSDWQSQNWGLPNIKHSDQRWLTGHCRTE